MAVFGTHRMIQALARYFVKMRSDQDKFPEDKIEAARSPRIILQQAARLRWAYRKGYRPVPGYTVCTKDGDRIYIAIEMEKIT